MYQLTYLGKLKLWDIEDKLRDGRVSELSDEEDQFEFFARDKNNLSPLRVMGIEMIHLERYPSSYSKRWFNKFLKYLKSWEEKGLIEEV